MIRKALAAAGLFASGGALVLALTAATPTDTGCPQADAYADVLPGQLARIQAAADANQQASHMGDREAARVAQQTYWNARGAYDATVTALNGARDRCGA